MVQFIRITFQVLNYGFKSCKWIIKANFQSAANSKRGNNDAYQLYRYKRFKEEINTQQSS